MADYRQYRYWGVLEQLELGNYLQSRIEECLVDGEHIAGQQHKVLAQWEILDIFSCRESLQGCDE